jgi:peroxiredoxin
MRTHAAGIFATVALVVAVPVTADSQGQEMNTSPAPAADALVRQGLDLVNHDKFDEAVAVFRNAIALAPNYLKAHQEYVRTRAYFQEAYNDVRIEYEALITKEPSNPVYPMAFELGTMGASSRRASRARYETVVALAPEWSWGHYAKAQLLLLDSAPEAAAAQLVKATEKDPTAANAYRRLISLLSGQLKRLDDAIATAERMAAQPDLRAEALATLWRLRVGRAQGSGTADAATAALKNELDHLFASSRDIDLLASVRSAYQNQLKDATAAQAVEKKLLQLDPAWHQWRGFTNRFGPANLSGVGRDALIAGRQMDLFLKVRAADDATIPAAEQIKRLEQVLALKPGPAMRRFACETLFKIAEKAQDVASLVKCGRELQAVDPGDTGVPARMALVLAEREASRGQALEYARMADEATTDFRPMRPTATEDPERFKDSLPDASQRNIHRRQRALALEAHGWALFHSGRHGDAEIKLRQAVEAGRSERNLAHLAEVLRKLGRVAEADAVAAESDREYAASITSRLINQPTRDFQLSALDGRKVKLSDLKGKVVLLNFWATTCGPCIAEMPHLVKLYERYRDRGVEILAISTDAEAERHAVRPFAAKFRVTFPVLYDDKTEDAYEVDGIPTTVFIDRQGQVRYRSIGFGDETMRATEVVLKELLKQP